MSTWQILPDAGGKDYRWNISGRIVKSKANGDPTRTVESTPPLPSMADLLLEGCSKLIERKEEENDKSPMFRTGLGKSVILKESSIAKALSLLNDGDATNSGELLSRDKGVGLSNSLFQTGSGKMVNISSAGLDRAKTLLGLEKDNDRCDLQRFHCPRTLLASKEQCQPAKSSLLQIQKGENDGEVVEGNLVSKNLSPFRTGLAGMESVNKMDSTMMHAKLFNSSKVPPIKFHTAGGRSLSVSSDALERARNLLRDPELGNFLDDIDGFDPSSTFTKEIKFGGTVLNKENGINTSLSYQGAENNTHTPNDFISPLRASFKQSRSLVKPEKLSSGSNLIKEFDAVDSASGCRLNINKPFVQEPLSSKPSASDLIVNNNLKNVVDSTRNLTGGSSSAPLADISNCFGTDYIKNKQTTSEKKRLGKTRSTPPFKRPRCSKFSTPLKKNAPFVLSGLSTITSDPPCSKRVVSSRYPNNVKRKYLKEYFGVAQLAQSKSELLSDHVRKIQSDNADKYLFTDEFGVNSIGVEAFRQMLAQSGASMEHASREWVTNHYKSIVWKLASYQRCNLNGSSENLFTIPNVLEELKYRYEREVNHGHRSAVKRILEGDAPASLMLVLCISAIHSNCKQKIDNPSMSANGTGNIDNVKVELTDGWYSIDAALDALLSKQFYAGKLFVGQKLRIWGAGLCGWVGPVSPFEASNNVSLQLNMNGTYRAHWAERLGFCKGVGAPLAFWCIKSNGGAVPSTLVGVTRIYPILYKERLSSGKSIVRSERVETKMRQLYSQKRSVVVEGLISEYQREVNGYHNYNHNDSDSEEGAKILKVLESAAEPEVLMAEMSPEQLTSFAAYKAKLEMTRQREMENSIKKALEGADLNDRDVTPFMRVRVVGLTSINHQGNGRPREGIITVWNPTEKQKCELVEGKAYIIRGLIPMNSDSETLYLQARGTSTKWKPLSHEVIEHFEPFFNPREPVSLSNLGEVPLCSEFDIAAYIVYVGDVYMDAQHKKQWVFVTDGSHRDVPSGDISSSLLAISFCAPYVDDSSFTQVNSNLTGSTVGFCNLIKRAKDQKNDLWVAEATENSTYFLSLTPTHCSHLKSAAASAQRWAETSNLVIDKLREKTLFIIGDCKD